MKKPRTLCITLGACLLSAALLTSSGLPASAAPLSINLSALSVSTSLATPQNVQSQATGDGRLRVSWTRPNLTVAQVLTGYVVKIVDGNGTVVETDTVDGTTTGLTSNVLPNGSYGAQISTVVLGLISLPASSGLVSVSLVLPQPSTGTTPVPVPTVSATAPSPTTPAPSPSTTIPTTPTPAPNPSASTPGTPGAPGDTPSTPSAPAAPTGVPTSTAPQPGATTPTQGATPTQPTPDTSAAPVADAPVAVPNLTSTVMSPTELSLSWGAPGGKYTHFMLKVEGKGFSRTYTTTDRNYRIKGLKPGAYTVHLSTCNAGSCTAWKDIRIASTSLPGQVKRLTVSKTAAHTSTVVWARAGANGGQQVRWHVLAVQAKSAKGWGKVRFIATQQTTSAKLTKLKAHTTYRVRVAGINANANGYTKALTGKYSKYRYFKTR